MTEILNFRTRFGSAHLKAPNVVDFVLGELGKAKANNLVHAHIALGDPDQPLADAPIDAQVNSCNLGGSFGQQGRWVVACDECAGVEYVDLEHPVFMCCNCFNTKHGHQWRPVKLPKAKERAEIEKILVQRKPLNRAWLPGETVADLRAQNAELHRREVVDLYGQRER